jgi:hypothetical protein
MNYIASGGQAGRRAEARRIWGDAHLCQNGSYVKFPFIDVEVNGTNVNVPGVDMKLTEINVDVNGVDVKLTEIDVNLHGIDMKLTEIDVDVTIVEMKLSGTDVNVHIGVVQGALASVPGPSAVAERKQPHLHNSLYLRTMSKYTIR